MKTTMLGAVIVTMVIIASMVVASCSSPAATTTTNPTASAPTTIPTTSITSTPPSSAAPTVIPPVPSTTKPQYGGGIRYAFTLEAGSLDPLTLVSGGDETYWRQMFDELVDGGQNLKGTPEFSLAQSWEMPDNQSMIFHLRQGVKFQDGTDFNAAAVKFNIDRVRDPKNGSTYLTLLTPIISEDVIDNYTVKFNLKNPWGAWLGALDSGASAMSSPTAVTGEGKAYSFKPVGTGPFVFSDYVPGSSCRMIKNPNYWGKDSDGNPLPYLDSVTILVIPDQTVVTAALQTGKADVGILPTQAIAKFQADPHFSVFSAVGGVTSQITFNIAKPPMDNVYLRQAIAYAVDPNEVNQAVYFGTALVSKGDLWPADSWAYDDNVGHPYYDQAKAKQLLALGGMPNGFTMDALTYSSPVIQQQAQIYQAQLAKVGIQLNLVLFDVTTATSKFYTQGAYPIFFNSWSRRPEPDRVASLVYMSNSFYNPSKLPNPTMDALVTKGASLYDLDQRKDVYHQISLVTIGQCWVTPELYAVQYMAAWKKVGGTDHLLGWDIVARFKRVWFIQ